jgi:Mg2+/Co2+ transporter CorB
VLWLQQDAGKAIAIAFATCVVLIFAAHVVPMSFWPTWVTDARGFAISKLGPLGDSFAPLTAIFAAIAALGAWRSYSTQREQLEQDNARIEQEKGRHREQMERQREQLETLKKQHRPAAAVPIPAIGGWAALSESCWSSTVCRR